MQVTLVNEFLVIYFAYTMRKVIAPLSNIDPTAWKILLRFWESISNDKIRIWPLFIRFICDI
jgi:hypothetical protein